MTKMLIDRSTVEQALEAWDGGEIEWFKRAYTVMENLRSALAEPVQEFATTNIGCLGMPVNTPVTPPQTAEPVQDAVAQISANRVIAAIEEWKSLWWKVPPFASKVNRATREAITVSHNPLFALLLDAQAAKQMPKGCTTPSGCQQHGCHGECLPTEPQRPAEPVQEHDLSRCPKCGGPADNGHDREVPPNPYVCTKCMAEPVAWRWGYRSVTTGEMDWRGYVEIPAHPNLRSPAIIMEPLYTAPPPPQRLPLSEEEIEKAHREIWRDLPSDFDHTSSGWIEQGIRYAERAHGINYDNQDNKR